MGKEVQFGMGSALAGEQNRVEVGNGYTNFEISWSVNITPTKKLTNPKIDKIQFVSTKWDE